LRVETARRIASASGTLQGRACTTVKARSTPGPSCQSSDPLPSHCTCLCTSSTTTATASGLNNRKTLKPLCVAATWSLTRPARNSFVLEKRTAESHSRDDEQRALTPRQTTIIHTQNTLSPLGTLPEPLHHHWPQVTCLRLTTLRTQDLIAFSLTSSLTRHPNPLFRNDTPLRILRTPQRASISFPWIDSSLISSRYPKFCCQTSAVL
jgi:hypothetical protein